MMIKRCVLWMIGIILFMQMSQAAVKNNVSRFTNNELNRDEWKVSASNIRNENQAPGKAIDDKVNTRWTNGAIQKGGEGFQIDMNSKQSFNEIELFQAKAINDYPRAYEVYVSQDGTNWGKPIASGKGIEGEATIITLKAPVDARYVKIVQTGTADSSWWSIHEIYIRKK